MATRLYSIALDDKYNDVVQAVGSATATSEIEVTVDLAVVSKQKDVVEQLKKIIHYIEQSDWPPA